jgi:rod shape-determining protein MreD
MRDYGAIFLFGLLGLFLQVYPFTYLSSGAIKPDLLTMVVVYIGLSKPLLGGGMLAFLLGYGMDAFSGSTTGLYVFLKVTTFLFVYWVGKTFLVNHLVLKVILVFVCCLLETLVMVALVEVILSSGRVLHFVLSRGVVHAMATAAVSPLVLTALAWWEKRCRYFRFSA